MNNITSEGAPVELGAVELNESPIFGKLAVAGADGSRRGVDDMSQNALALRAPEAGDVAMELEYARPRCPRLFQLARNLLPGGSCLGVLALDLLPI